MKLLLGLRAADSKQPAPCGAVFPLDFEFTEKRFQDVVDSLKFNVCYFPSIPPIKFVLRKLSLSDFEYLDRKLVQEIPFWVEDLHKRNAEFTTKEVGAEVWEKAKNCNFHTDKVEQVHQQANFVYQ